MSLIDGKILAYLTNIASMQTCCICGAKPNDMNNALYLENGFIPNEENFSFEISALHCLMKFFEFLLHIAYRLDLKKWQVTTTFKEQYGERKKNILELFVDTNVIGGTCVCSELLLGQTNEKFHKRTHGGSTIGTSTRLPKHAARECY